MFGYKMEEKYGLKEDVELIKKIMSEIGEI
jgi:hypothetical protein